ncbi:hypothetical protein VNO77_01158 [Canavalia gladiata]|uniref:X8 domain-containing protein n=1 Tax=Canavalia gladiata TaxID=3824 RepID=A0AAN9R9Z9_CANGL
MLFTIITTITVWMKNVEATERWCVADPSASDEDLENALNFVCGSGADCSQIQPGQPCYKPNLLYSHVSYALSSYCHNELSSQFVV